MSSNSGSSNSGSSNSGSSNSGSPKSGPSSDGAAGDVAGDDRDSTTEHPGDRYRPTDVSADRPALDRILILGAKGQLGSALVNQEWPVGTFVLPATRDQLDITDHGAVRTYIQRWRPKVVINAAASTSVDGAEAQPDVANRVNHRAVVSIAEAAAAVDARLIHLSTDYVFDGAASGWYREHDQVNPLGAYGRSKRAGELAALQLDDALVLRTSWLYSSTGSNFVRTIRKLGRSRPVLQVVDDQRGCPTAADDLAAAIVVAIRAGLRHNGLFHVAAPDDATWCEFADEILRLDGTRDRVELDRITTGQYPLAARRPADSRISSDAFAAAYGHTLPPWRESLRRVSRQLDRTDSPPPPVRIGVGIEFGGTGAVTRTAGPLVDR